ncbi:helicase associated domain-containing protein [Streptomyces olivaceoviridis]|uniref:helicase associated domain-containing protein n=1 Tax=Streptomyces olivaceoviridis TaxID=1921 RepID=UPI0037952233
MYVREHGDLKVPFTYRVPGGQDQAVEAEGWPASLANFPLGQWIADNRRFYARGDMDEDRVEQLEKLGVVWSHFDVAWEEGLAAAHEWAEVNGHLLAPKDATYQGYKVGIWLKNARATARKAAEIEQRRAEGLPVQSSAGAMSDERREQLEDIDPSWCPAWPVEWQRAFHLVRLHLEAYWSPTSSNPPPPPRRRLRWRTRAPGSGAGREGHPGGSGTPPVGPGRTGRAALADGAFLDVALSAVRTEERQGYIERLEARRLFQLFTNLLRDLPAAFATPRHDLPPSVVHLATMPPSTCPLASLQATTHCPRLGPATQQPGLRRWTTRACRARAGSRPGPQR